MVSEMSVQNIFSPSASRIVRILLIYPEREWSILNLSKEAGTGYGHTYRLVGTLLKMGLSRKTETNRVKPSNPGQLLTRWASYYDFALSNDVEAYYSMDREVDSFLERLSSADVGSSKYALTLHAGAALVEPYVRPANVHIYIDTKEKSKWEKRLELKLTELGGNIFLVKPYDEGIFYGVQEVRGLRVVSNVQLYVDLYNYPARGREAAEHLRKKVIGF